MPIIAWRVKPATRLVVAKWGVATTLATAVPAVLIAVTWVLSLRQFALGEVPMLTTQQAAVSVLGTLAVASCGAALGVLFAGLLPQRPGWVTGLLILLALAQPAPGVPPVWPISAALPAGARPEGVPITAAESSWFYS